MDILQSFGVKPILLLAQAVNFFILLVILKKFLYKPVLKVLDERRRKITESLKNADEIEKRLEQIGEDREKKLQEAARDAEEIIREATQTAGVIVAQAHEKAAADAEKIIEKSRQSLELEREKLHQEVRSELADLVVAGLEKVIGKTLTEKYKKETVEKSLHEIG